MVRKHCVNVSLCGLLLCALSAVATSRVEVVNVPPPGVSHPAVLGTSLGLNVSGYIQESSANTDASFVRGGDTDSDEIPDHLDNCPLVANPAQTNTDGDELGDACDSDDDNDGLLDTEEDTNDNGTVQPGETDPLDSDTDDDGYSDGMEVTHGSDPLVITSVPAHGDPALNACLADAPEAFATFSVGALSTLQLSRKANSVFEFFQFDIEDWLAVSEDHEEFHLLRNSDSLSDRSSRDTAGEITGLSTIAVSEGGYRMVYSGSNGVVEAWDLYGGGTGLPLWAIDIKRSGCADRIGGNPVVQHRSFSSAAFGAIYENDLLYVVTRYSSGCGLGEFDEDNKVLALSADTGAVSWIFNEEDPMSGHPYDIGRLATPVLDYSSEMLFVVSERENPSQDSLWAIDVLTGTPEWSANLGAIWATPLVTENNVYILTLGGEVKAVDKMTGSTLWAISNGGTPLIANPELVQHPSGETYIASADIEGRVWLVRDEQLYGSEVWNVTLPGAVKATTSPVAGLGGENLFVGADDGRVYQLDLLTGAVEASRLLTANGAVEQLALQQDDPFNARLPSLFASSDEGTLYRYCQPFRTNTSPVDTDADGVTDGADNCPEIANAVQKDTDQDGIGDACDPHNLYFVSIGGALTGLAPGNSVVLNVQHGNATDELQLDASGTFTFSELLVDFVGLDYNVSVLVQPTTPNQLCSVSNGSGTPAGNGTDITDISVSCLVGVFFDGFESGDTGAWN